MLTSQLRAYIDAAARAVFVARKSIVDFDAKFTVSERGFDGNPQLKNQIFLDYNDAQSTFQDILLQKYDSKDEKITLAAKAFKLASKSLSGAISAILSLKNN